MRCQGGGVNNPTDLRVKDKNKKSLRKALIPLVFSILTIHTNTAKADDFGCEALLCFAGGKGIAECQPTIKEVLHRLKKGKPFPHCSFLSSDGSSNDNAVNTSLYSVLGKNRICADGVTVGQRIGFNRKYLCKTIEININKDFVADPSYIKQIFNYE